MCISQGMSYEATNSCDVQVILLTECQDHMQTDSCKAALQHLQSGLQQLNAEGLLDPLQQPGNFDKRLLMKEVCYFKFCL